MFSNYFLVSVKKIVTIFKRVIVLSLTLCFEIFVKWSLVTLIDYLTCAFTCKAYFKTTLTFLIKPTHITQQMHCSLFNVVLVKSHPEQFFGFAAMPVEPKYAPTEQRHPPTDPRIFDRLPERPKVPELT